MVRALVRDVKNRANPANAAELLAESNTHHFHMPGKDLPPGIAGSMQAGEIFGEASPRSK